MARTSVIPGGTARISGFVARHPKLVVGLLAMLLFLAVQDGAVATDGTLVEPNAEGSVYLGPEEPRGD